MREILFRAKTEPCSKNAISGKIELKPKWVYGYIDLGYMQDEKGAIISGEKAHSAYRCQYSTIGQYTGLKDKNGQKIFEGDLVQPVLQPSISQPSFAWPIMPVVFSDGVFGLRDHRGNVTPLSGFAPRVTFEVMGNVHDNPEMMKGGNEWE